MLTKEELRLVYQVSKNWNGPNTWAWLKGYHLGLKEAIRQPGYG